MCNEIDKKSSDSKPVEVPNEDAVDVMGGESKPVAPVAEQATEG